MISKTAENHPTIRKMAAEGPRIDKTWQDGENEEHARPENLKKWFRSIHLVIELGGRPTMIGHLRGGGALTWEGAWTDNWFISEKFKYVRDGKARAVPKPIQGHLTSAMPPFELCGRALVVA